MSSPRSACSSTRIRHKLDCLARYADSASDKGNSDVAKILVVDDDPVMQMTVRLLSERAGHGGVADDGRKDFAEFKTGHFDLVFLDYHADNGRTGDRGPGWRTATAIPVIAMSGRLGAVRSLPEPFKPPALPATVAECLVTATKPPAQPTSDSNVASRR
jgi:DNA-binding response OmpR family regulator